MMCRRTEEPSVSQTNGSNHDDGDSGHETIATLMDQQSPTSTKPLNHDELLGHQSISPHSVIIGRGNSCRQHPGNQRLESLAKSMLSEYAQASGRNAKSRVVSALIDHVHSKGGEFVRYDEKNSTYTKVNMRGAREKVGVVLRNLVGPMKYKSSCQSKVVARRERKALSAQPQQQQTDGLEKKITQSSEKISPLPSPAAVRSNVSIPERPEPSLSLSSPAFVLSQIIIPPKPTPKAHEPNARDSRVTYLDNSVDALLSSHEIFDIQVEDLFRS